MPYKHGNLSDCIKHAKLENLVSVLKPDVYIEFHSAEGLYPLDNETFYEGSAIRAIKILDSFNDYYTAYLHEKDPRLRAELMRNIGGHPNVHIREKWQKSIQEYLARADSKSLFLIDPTSMPDYIELIPAIDKLLKKRANMFLFAPQTLSSKLHESLVADIFRVIKENQRSFRDFYNETGSGYFKRRDYNIIVADEDVLKNL